MAGRADQDGVEDSGFYEIFTMWEIILVIFWRFSDRFWAISRYRSENAKHKKVDPVIYLIFSN